MIKNQNIALSNSNTNIRKVPIVTVRMMTDDEWNRLAYKNWLERQAKSHVRA